MTTPLAPGVYVQEVPGGPRSIEAAPTAVTIFVGETERGPIEPTPVGSPQEFERIYGGYFRHRAATIAALGAAIPPFSKLLMRYAIQGYFNNGGPRAYVLRTMDAPAPPVGGSPASGAVEGSRAVTDGATNSNIIASSPGVWGNFLSVAVVNSNDGDGSRFKLDVYYRAPGEDSLDLVEEWDGLSPDTSDEKYVIDVLQRSSFIRWRAGDTAIRPDNDPAAPPQGVILAMGSGGDANLAIGNYSGFLDWLREIDDAALIVNASDQLLTLGDPDYMTLSNAFITYAENRPQTDLFFVGDLPRFAGAVGSARIAAVAGAARAGTSRASNFCGMYWPHFNVADPVGEGANPSITLPPAGHIAGLYGRTDSRRGVWKAPAGVNLVLGGVRSLDFNVHDSNQESLNPQGVNALRQIPGAGLVIWGARTRQPSTQWRYVPVRRTAMFLRKSIYNGIQWAVFEPNDEPLWSSLRATIGAFMETQFRNGAFAGATSDDAYFVKVDADTTTPADQTAGVVNILVGFAPLRPAEFVIVKLSQKTATQA